VLGSTGAHLCDKNNKRAIEVTHTKKCVWQCGGDLNVNDPASSVAFAGGLENDNTLITDSNHARIVEIDHDKNVVWEYFTCTGQDYNLPRGPRAPCV